MKKEKKTFSAKEKESPKISQEKRTEGQRSKRKGKDERT